MAKLPVLDRDMVAEMLLFLRRLTYSDDSGGEQGRSLTALCLLLGKAERQSVS